MDSQLKTLIAERGSGKAKLTIFKKFVETTVVEDDYVAFEKRVKAHEPLYSRFDRIQSQIEAIVIGTDNEAAHLLEREFFDDTYFRVLSSAEKQLSQVRGSRSSTASPAVTTTPTVTDSSHATRLPVIKLPTFNGDLGQWIRFRDTFTSLVHDSDKLTDIDRFNYLNSSLTGPAARVLESFSVSATNYALAWARLRERYENPRALVDHHINALLDIEAVRKPDGALLNQLIDTATNHVRALESVLKPSELWEALISSHLSRKIDSSSLDEWEKRITDTPNRPALREFAKFLEQR
ncbi:hypothetical protein WH47_02485 [Habropoda laboriosa]|uniref:Uncharacterized protein n=1 Tax=Habropoda laboriosa TaxID=597456 RepID=A0A0L7QYE0_9HYME|nr:hypothetical protein WH47_02485 [Habropoda laboriosa]